MIKPSLLSKSKVTIALKFLCHSEIEVTSYGIVKWSSHPTFERQVFDIDHCFYRLSTVMDIFRSRLYRVNVTLLSLVGLWPNQKSRSWQFFQKCICQISVITVILSQAIRMFEVWGNIDIMIECLTPIGVQLIATIKSLNAIINEKKMKKLLEIMQTDWSSLRDEKETEIFMKYTEEGSYMSLLYAEFTSSCAFVYLLVPLLPRILDVIVPLNESRSTGIYLYHTQYYVDPEENWIWICLHTYVGTIITITTIIAADTMFACYVMHVRAVLAVIGYRLRNLTSKRSENDISDVKISKDDDYRCFQEIAYSIDQHHRALEVVKIIESAFSTSYLLVIGVSMLLMSMSMVQILIKLGQVGEMIRLLQFNLAQCNHLLFNSWPSQKLIDESINFREAIYASEWYSLSETNKHLLRFAMMRTIEPQKITAGGLYTLSIETFGLVIKSAISYFTVFSSIR